MEGQGKKTFKKIGWREARVSKSGKILRAPTHLIEMVFGKAHYYSNADITIPNVSNSRPIVWSVSLLARDALNELSACQHAATD